MTKLVCAACGKESDAVVLLNVNGLQPLPTSSQEDIALRLVRDHGQHAVAVEILGVKHRQFQVGTCTQPIFTCLHVE